MEAAFRYLAEEIRQEMRAEMMKVVEQAATSCASICMDRMQALRAEMLSEFEEATETKGGGESAAKEVRRRTSFYELYTDDVEVRMGSDQEDDGEDLASIYDHLEKCARRRSSTSVPSMPSAVAQGGSPLPVPQVQAIETLRGQVFPKEEQKASRLSEVAGISGRRASDSTEEELIALDDFLKAPQNPPATEAKAPQSVEDRVAFLEFFLYPAAAPKTKSSLSLEQRVDLLDGHLWGQEAGVFEVLEMKQRVRLAERALLGVARA